MLKTKKHKERVKYSGSPKQLFGLEVPCNVREALELDKKNGNHRWVEAIHTEMKGLQDHKTISFLNPGEAAWVPVCTFKDEFHSEARSQVQGQVGDWRSCC